MPPTLPLARPLVPRRALPYLLFAAALLAPLVLASCASAQAAAERPADGEPGGAAARYAAVPGFDTRDYPGDAAMAQWRARSPYRWVGYYLSAPCYTGTSWTGRRAALERMGWGIALLFVGEQDWAADDAPPADSLPPRCTRANVTAERGAADGSAAADAAAAEGFPRGSAIFLDVERVDSVSAALDGYVRAWAAQVVRDGRYRPALYAHARNAEELLGAMRAAAPEREIPLWVASPADFDLTRSPADSGVAGAALWQGAFDVTERWGDATLRIDRNVADVASPSAPR